MPVPTTTAMMHGALRVKKLLNSYPNHLSGKNPARSGGPCPRRAVGSKRKGLVIDFTPGNLRSVHHTEIWDYKAVYNSICH